MSPTEAINIAVFGGIPILVAGIGSIYFLIARRADKLEGRFDTVDTKIESVKIDLSKTKTAVAYIRGQLSGTANQRRKRREEENGNSYEDE